MGRGKTSRGKIYQGEIVSISCPCGWETSFNFKDQGLCERMATRAKRNHQKVCPQIGDFEMDYEGDYINTKEFGVASMINNSFKRNEEDIEARKKQAKNPV